VSDQESGVARVGVGALDGVPAVQLAAGELEASFLPRLGLLGASLRHRGEELLALPGGIAGYRGGHVTGLPLLAPWANRLPAWRYRAAGAEVNTDINLDGLVANEEKTYDYKAVPPLRRHKEPFAFESLKVPGLYVIEIIGGGTSSRSDRRIAAGICPNSASTRSSPIAASISQFILGEELPS